MARYYKFKYSAGYVGTDVEEVIEVPDNYSNDEVEKIFDGWYEEQLTASGGFEEISGEEALEIGIADTYCVQTEVFE